MSAPIVEVYRPIFTGFVKFWNTFYWIATDYNDFLAWHNAYITNTLRGQSAKLAWHKYYTIAISFSITLYFAVMPIEHMVPWESEDQKKLFTSVKFILPPFFFLLISFYVLVYGFFYALQWGCNFIFRRRSKTLVKTSAVTLATYVTLAASLGWILALVIRVGKAKGWWNAISEEHFGLVMFPVIIPLFVFACRALPRLVAKTYHTSTVTALLAMLAAPYVLAAYVFRWAVVPAAYLIGLCGAIYEVIMRISLPLFWVHDAKAIYRKGTALWNMRDWIPWKAEIVSWLAPTSRPRFAFSAQHIVGLAYFGFAVLVSVFTAAPSKESGSTAQTQGNTNLPSLDVPRTASSKESAPTAQTQGNTNSFPLGAPRTGSTQPAPQ